MNLTLFRTQASPIDQNEILWLPPTPILRRLALAIIVVFAAGLRFANLETLGYANHYYTAAVASMLQSWHNFFFVAAEPGGAVSVDKPPLGLWLQTISAYFLGVNGFAVLLPEIVAGLLSVVLIYHLVRRSFGAVAGLLAALALAITPIVVATDRNNTIDSLLIFTLLLATWAFIKATESSRLCYLLLGAVLVGLGFNIKMLQAYLPLPAFCALYFLGAAERVQRKIVNLALATVVLLVVSLSWAVAVDLTPASQRPFVGSSGNNSVLSLALGYNGVQRLIGMRPGGGGMQPVNEVPGSLPQPGTSPNGAFLSPPGQTGQNPPLGGGNRPGGLQGPGGPGGGFPGTGQAGPFRLFTTPLSKEVSWFLPFGLFSVALLLFRTRLRWPLDPKHQAVVLWGGWLFIGAVFFSVAQFFHEYYLSMLGAPLAALVGIGVVELWRMRQQRPWLSLGLLLLAAGVTLGLQYFTVVTFVSRAWWLLPTLALFGVGAGLLVVSMKRQLSHGAMLGFACVIAALLLTPGIWSSLTVLQASANQSLPSAYGGRGGGPNGDAGRPFEPPPGSNGPQAGLPSQQGQDSIEVSEQPVSRTDLHLNQALLNYLTPRTQGMTYLMAVPSSMQGADYVIATGRPVLYLGGFNGVDQVVSGDDLARLVAEGKLRYIYWGGGEGGPGGGRGPGPGGVASLSTWVTAHCTPVEGFETETSNFGAPDGITSYSSAVSSSRGMQVALYDCGN